MKNIKCFIASKKNDRFEFEEEDMLGGCTPSEYDKWPGGHFKKVLKINNYPETTFVIYSKDRLGGHGPYKFEKRLGKVLLNILNHI